MTYDEERDVDGMTIDERLLNDEMQRLRDGLRAIKNDARLIRSLVHDNTQVANLATGIYHHARTLLADENNTGSVISDGMRQQTAPPRFK